MEPMSHLAVDEQPSFDRGGRHGSVCMVCEYLGGIYIESISTVVGSGRKEPTHLERWR